MSPCMARAVTRDHRQVGTLRHGADRGRRGVAVHLRHHHVHQDEIDVLVGPQHPEALVPVGCVDDGEPVQLKDAGDREGVAQVIVNDQDAPAAQAVVCSWGLRGRGLPGTGRGLRGGIGCDGPRRRVRCAGPRPAAG